MGALSTVHATSLLNTSLRSATRYLALFLTDPTSAATGTEVSGGNYARKIINFNAPTVVSGKAQATNADAIDYGVMTADLGTVAYWAIYDDMNAGNMYWYGTFNRSKNVFNGDAITIETGAIVCEIS